jgi:hypothetical protein
MFVLCAELSVHASLIRVPSACDLFYYAAARLEQKEGVRKTPPACFANLSFARHGKNMGSVLQLLDDL